MQAKFAFRIDRNQSRPSVFNRFVNVGLPAPKGASSFVCVGFFLGFSTLV